MNPDDVDPKLNRLLRAAAAVPDDAPAEAPFAFDTRVVALWRSGSPNGGNGVVGFVRRVAAVAIAVIIVSSAAAFYESTQTIDQDEPFGNEFAIADSAIESELP